MAVCKPSQLQRYRSGTEIESTESDFTVKVESELDKGTTFVLTFPIAAKLAPVTDAQIKLAS